VTTCTARFAHSSEADLARLLDFYGVDWRYEPRSFPIAWDRAGNAVQSFTPDFYLPDFDVYVELTVMQPRFQTRKNRKLRLLRQYHPEISIKLFTKRDVEKIFSQKFRRAS
jgi:hypothetical protein